LTREEFADARAELEQLFRQRQTGASGLGTPNYTEIRARTGDLQATLNRLVRQLSSAEFSVANKFIQSLGYEARFVAGRETLAAN